MRWPDFKAPLIPLELDETVVLSCSTPCGQATVQVTPLDANHCLVRDAADWGHYPFFQALSSSSCVDDGQRKLQLHRYYSLRVVQGAVMFLFDGSFGRVLHCGDFRWETDYQEQCLHPVLTSAAIDTIYLDNTYAHPR